jgi:predicted nuclease with TOPRIM domain
MDIFQFIFQPSVFIILLPVLLIVSTMAVFSLLRQDRKNNGLREELNKEVCAKERLEKRVAQLEAEAVRLNNDLDVKTQMYNGLKDQYEELEKDFDRVNKV